MVDNKTAFNFDTSSLTAGTEIVEEKQYPDEILPLVEGLGADDVVLFLLEKPELLPRVPAKTRIPDSVPNRHSRRERQLQHGAATEEPQNSGSGRPVGSIAQVEDAELTAGRAPCEPAARSRSAGTTSSSGCPRRNPLLDVRGFASDAVRRKGTGWGDGGREKGRRPG
jgi:hypothetical protein